MCVKTKGSQWKVNFSALKKKMLGVAGGDTLKHIEFSPKFKVTLTQLSFLLKECQVHLEISLLSPGSHLVISPLQKYLAKS